MYTYEEIARRIAFNVVRELITDESPAEERIEKVMTVFRKLGLTNLLDTTSRITSPLTMPKAGPGVTIQVLLNNAMDTKNLIENCVALEENLGLTPPVVETAQQYVDRIRAEGEAAVPGSSEYY